MFVEHVECEGEQIYSTMKGQNVEDLEFKALISGACFVGVVENPWFCCRMEDILSSHLNLAAGPRIVFASTS